MTEQLAQHFADRLLRPPTGEPLPFLDRVAGLVRPYVRTVQNGDDTRRITLPVPSVFTEQDCEKDSRYLVPDLNTASILFFEDQGSVGEIVAMNVPGWVSSLRLLLWLNPAKLEGEVNDAAILNALVKSLGLGQRRTINPFRDLLSSYSVPVGGASLLGSYSFDDTPLLYPPYKVLALDIRATYQLSADCYQAALPTKSVLASC